MEPVDKLGRQIYPKTYSKMLTYGRTLKKFGYRESLNKPNLFYRKDEDNGVVFFADMRGTDVVPVYEDPSPMLYAKFPDVMPTWKRKRIFEQEYGELPICRVSFYEEFEPEGLMFGDGGNGFCIVCGKDFHNEGLYCSPQCEEAHKSLTKVRCRVCGKVLEYTQSVEHHLNYAENKKITVCRSCHLKIHRGTKLPNLKPSKK